MSFVLKKVFLICCFFICISANASKTTIAAVINDDIIFAREVDDRIELIKKLSNSKAETRNEEEFLKKQSIESLIIEKLLFKDAKKRFLTIDNAYVNETLKQIAADSAMNLNQFKNTLGPRLFESLRNQIKFEMLKGKILSTDIAEKIAVSEAEVDEAFKIGSNNDFSKIYNIKHLQVPMGEFKSRKIVEDLVKFLSHAKNCQTLEKKAESKHIKSYLLNYELPLENLKSRMREILKDLKIGQLSKIYESEGKFYDIFMLCGEKKVSSGVKEKEQIRQLIREHKAILALKSYLDELKRNAYIEIH